MYDTCFSAIKKDRNPDLFPSNISIIYQWNATA